MASLKAGAYAITVDDRSRNHDFRLRGPGVNKVFSSVAAIGTKTVTVKLRAGRSVHVPAARRRDARCLHGSVRTGMNKKRLIVPLLASAAVLGGGYTINTATGARAAVVPAAASAAGVDQRAGGFEIALGEWALWPRPRRSGQAGDVRRLDRGKFRHGLELEIRRIDDDRDDDRGTRREVDEALPGPVDSDDARSRAGVYEIECLISHHDDMGMRGGSKCGGLTAAQTAVEPRARPWRSRLHVQAATLKTTAGKTVTSRNPTRRRTATAAQFSSPQLAKGGATSVVSSGGHVHLPCALHPGMKGKIVVAGGKG